jgi:hypothetical protein
MHDVTYHLRQRNASYLLASPLVDAGRRFWILGSRHCVIAREGALQIAPAFTSHQQQRKSSHIRAMIYNNCEHH